MAHKPSKTPKNPAKTLPAEGKANSLPPWEEDEKSSSSSPSKGLYPDEDTIITGVTDRVNAEFYGAQERLFKRRRGFWALLVGILYALEGFWNRLKATFQKGSPMFKPWVRQNKMGLGVACGLIFFLSVVLVVWGPGSPQEQTTENITPEINPMEPERPAKGIELAEIRIESQPTGARVILNGEDTGDITPLNFVGLEAQLEHSLEIRLPGYEVIQTQFTLKPGEKRRSTPFRLKKLPSSQLRILSQPPDVEVYMDGQWQGKTPLSLSMASQGKAVRLKLQKKGYLTHEEWLDLSQEDTSITRQLKKKSTPSRSYASVKLTSKPTAMVYIDGKRLNDMTPILNQKLQVGRPYEIKFVNPKNFKKITLKEVTLKKNARGNYGLDFNGQKISRKMHSKITIYDKGSQPTLRVDLE